MSYDSTAQTVRGRFASEWLIQQPNVPVFYDNAGVDTIPRDSSWVRLTVLFGESAQVEFGNQRRWRRIGIAAVQIFVPAGVGDGLAQELGDSVTAVYEGRTISGVIFRATSLERIGIDGPWLQMNASTPFQSDDLS